MMLRNDLYIKLVKKNIDSYSLTTSASTIFWQDRKCLSTRVEAEKDCAVRPEDDLG